MGSIFFIKKEGLKNFSLQFYNYKIKLLSDIPLLINYLKKNYLNLPKTTPQKEIEIIFLRKPKTSKSIKCKFSPRKMHFNHTPFYEYFLDFENLSAFITMHKYLNNPIGYYAIFQNTLKTLLQAEGFFSIHASSWTNDRISVLATGKSGAGKSTLLINAIQKGYKIVGDDSIFIAKKEHIITAGLPYIGGFKKQNFKLDLAISNWINNSKPTHILFLEKADDICHFQIVIPSLKETLLKLLCEIFPLRFAAVNKVFLTKRVIALLYTLTLQAKSVILKINPLLLKKANLKQINLWQKIEEIILKQYI
ncbi:MAG: hypothetical protein NC818_05115 [Candidatus Omnitrophica bacterium]|nr:hypothetical protein [Candidatus Omnitrophota bacterium]